METERVVEMNLKERFQNHTTAEMKIVHLSADVGCV